MIPVVKRERERETSSKQRNKSLDSYGMVHSCLIDHDESAAVLIGTFVNPFNTAIVKVIHVNSSHNKTSKCSCIKIIFFVHIICHKPDMLGSILII